MNVWKTTVLSSIPPRAALVSPIDFLGHHVDATGIRPLEEKAHAIQAFPLPDTQRKLRRFLGLVNFCHNPPTATTHASQANQASFRLASMDHENTTVFETVKQALANATLLIHPVTNAPTNIMSDVSDIAVGAVLQQYINGQWCPLSFFSKALKPAETRYSVYDRELLAIYLAIRHFRYFLEGRHFHVLTDHKPLIYALSSRPDRHSPRQVRYHDFISQFTTDLRHIQGSANTAADTLSCLETNALHTGNTSVVDFRELALAQAEDPELPRLQADLLLQLESVPFLSDGVSLICDISTGVQRPYVPQSFRQTICDSLHSFSHPGIRATQHLVTSRYVWPTSTVMFGIGLVLAFSASGPKSIAT